MKKRHEFFRLARAKVILALVLVVVQVGAILSRCYAYDGGCNDLIYFLGLPFYSLTIGMFDFIFDLIVLPDIVEVLIVILFFIVAFYILSSVLIWIYNKVRRR